MAEIQRGGAYRVDGKIVDANGKEVQLKAATTDTAKGTESPPPVVYVEGVQFGSDAAGQAAKDAGLTAADFDGYKASGLEGYTKPDVAKVIASKEAAR
jgi:hypothetical protein